MIWAGMDTLGERIKEALDRKGWKEIRLAAEVGTVESTVKRWISNEVKPRLETVPELAGALGVSISWLLTGREEDSAEPIPPAGLLTMFETVLDAWEAAGQRDDPRRPMVEATVRALRQRVDDIAVAEALPPGQVRDDAIRSAERAAAEALTAAALGDDPSLAGVEADERFADEAVQAAEDEVPPAGEAGDPRRGEGDQPSRRSA